MVLYLLHHVARYREHAFNGRYKMSMFERRVLAELRTLREAEAALEGVYRTLSSAADSGRFLASLRSLEDRVSRLETLLESVA